MTRGFVGTSRKNTRRQLRGSTAFLMAVLLLAPGYAAAEDLRWRITNGGDADGNWRLNNDRWLNDSDVFTEYEEGDNVTFGNVYDLNGDGDQDVGEDLFGTGYTVTVTAGGNNNALEVNDMVFGVDGVVIDANGNRSLNVGGTITVLDDGLGGQDSVELQIPISAGDITKLGDGRLVLDGDNTTSGAVSVNEGRLNVSGSLTGPSSVTVADGATLGGQGSITGNVVIDDNGSIVGGLDIDGTLTGNGIGSSLEVDGGTVSGLATLNGATTAGGMAFNGGVDNTTTGVFDVAAETGVQGTFDNDGAITNSLDGSFTLSGMTTFENDGSIDAGAGDLTIDAATINLNTDTTVTGTVNLTGAVNVNGMLDYTNTGAIDGDVTVASDATFENAAGSSVADDHTISSLGTVEVTGGTVGSVALNGGTGTFSGGVANGTIDVGPAGAAAGDVSATIDGDFTAANLDLNGGDAAFDTSILVTNNSDVNVTGTLDADHLAAAASNATLTVDDGSTLSAAIFDIGEDVTVNNSGELAGGTLINDGGVITNTLTGLISADVSNTTGSITNNGEMSGSIAIFADSFDNNGTISNLGALELNGATAILNANSGSDSVGLITNTDGRINALGGGFSGGVRNFDFMDVSADTSGGTIENNLNGLLDINDSITLTANVSQVAAGTVDINGTVAGNVTASDGDIDLNGAITGTVMLTDAAATLNTGFLLDGTTASTITGLVTSEGIVNAANTTFTGGILNNTGGTVNVQEDITGTVTNNGGDVIVSATKTITGDLDNDAGITTQAGIVDGNASVGGGTFNNTGQITGALALSGGFYNAIVGGQVDGTTTNDGGTINADGGAFGASGITNTSGALNLNTSYAMDVAANGGSVVIDAATVLTGDFAQGGATTTNDGQIVDDIAMTGGTLDNNLTLTGTVDVDGGILNMQSGSNVTGAVTVDMAGTVNANGGTFDTGSIQVNGGDLNVNAATTLDVTNDGGEVTMAAVTLTGNFDNQSGDATLAGTITGNVDIGGVSSDDIVRSTANIGGTLDLSGGRFIAEGGTITGQVTNSGGNLRLDGVTLTTDVDNTSGNVIVIGNTTADVENTGGDLTINEFQTLTGLITNTSGETVNEGTVDGNVTLADGLYRNFGTTTGTVTASGGIVNMRDGQIIGLVTNNGSEVNAELGNFAGGVLNNSGEFDVRDTITALNVTNDGGTFFVRDGALLTSDVTNSDGAADNAGTIDGTFDLTGGTLAMNGTITGVATVNGTGQMTANDGATFDQEVQSDGGDIFVAGNMTGDVNNDGGALRIQTSGSLTGNVTQVSNLTNNNGDIFGAVVIDGGSLSQRSGADTTMLTTLNGGTLNLEGGDFSGGILTNGGTFNMTADTVANVENDGAAIILPTGFTLTGDVTNTSGNIGVRSAVIGSMTQEAGNAVYSATSSVSDETIQNGGAATINGGDFDGKYTAVAGTLDINGDMVGRVFVEGTDVTVDTGVGVDGRMNLRSGTVVSDGTIIGGATVRGGTFDNTGVINGKLLVRNDGVFNHDGAGVVTGKSIVEGGELNVDGGTFDRKIVVDGGVVTILANTSVKVNVNSGEETTNDLIVRNSVTLTGNVNNTGRFRLQGILLGDLDNSGTVNLGNNGEIQGEFTNTGTLLINGVETSKFAASTTAKSSGNPVALPGSGGTPIFLGTVFNNNAGGDLTVTGVDVEFGDVFNAGDVTVTDNRVLFSDTFTIRDGGVVSLDSGGLDSPVITGDAGSSIVMRDGDIEGALTTAGDILVRGSDTSNMFGDIDLNGSGTLTVRGELFNVDGTLDAASNTEVTLADGSTLATNGFTNRGVMSMGDGSTIEGDLTNTGVINGTGTLTFGSGITGAAGTVDVSGNGSTADRIRVGGSGIDGSTFGLDIDLGSEDGTSDRIVMTSATMLTGDVTLDFNVLDSGAQQGEDGVLVLDVNGADVSGLQLSAIGLPDDDPLRLYGLSQSDNGDVVVRDSLNPAVGGLAGSIVLTQSLIGSVVNRPTSPFVSGLAIEGEDPCGAGLWARATGGQADTNGLVSQDGLPDVSSELSANYYGVQLGGDWACFEGFYNGWDMAFGGIAGANFGDTTQPVFAPVLNLGGDTGVAENGDLTSVTDVTFQQAYGGVYGTAVKGPLAVDLQYRVEQTDYTANNTGQNGNPGLGLEDETFSSEAQTLSGAVSYSIPLEQYDLTFVPTAGFAYSQISVDEVTFSELGSVQVEDFESQVGFIGGTIARTRIGDDGVSAINQFATATVYSDFAPDPTSTFTTADGSFEQTITSENLGTYGELSAGLSYVKILQPGEFGAVRQFNASVRADVRYSDQLESWGLTAQARLQF